QCDLGGPPLCSSDQADESTVQRVAVGKSGQRIIFGEISDTFGLALADGNVAQDRAILEAVRALPARKARLNRKGFAVLASSFELDDHGTAGDQQRLPRSVSDSKGLRTGFRRNRAKRFEGATDD